MNYSVKTFVKNNCSGEYDLEGFKDIAKKMLIDSEGRYTHDSAIELLCRYAYVDDNSIMFNSECRNPDQKLDNLIAKLDLTNNKKRTNGNNNNDANDDNNDDDFNKKHVIDSDDDDDNDNVVEKIEKKPTKTTKNTSPKKIIKTENSKEMHNRDTTLFSSLINTEISKKKDNKESSNKKEISKTKVEDREKNQPAKKKDIKEISNKKEISESKMDDDEKNQPTKKKDINDISEKKVDDGEKNQLIKKKSGFGILKKSMYINDEENETGSMKNDYNTKNNVPLKRNTSTGTNTKANANTKTNTTTTTTNNSQKTGTYVFPTEKKYPSLVRTDNLFGPYGTDNFYDDNIKNDDIDAITKKRVNIYRKLESQYYPAQRSPEWFKMRDELTTASDGGTVVGLNPYEKTFDFVLKKVHGKPFETSEDCYHGKKYEQIATMTYEYRMNVRVKEFGLCRHPKYNFLGASPDGIVSEYKLRTKDGRTWDEIETELALIEEWEDKRSYMEEFGIKTKYVGRMLEIKCPMRRKIIMDPNAIEVYGVHGEQITDLKTDVKKGICPTYYWVQVQLQLQCCELDECDFWQCEIVEYPSKDDFLDDCDPTHPWLSRQTCHEKGAVIQLLPHDQVNNKIMNYNDRIYNFAQFIYQPRIDMTPTEIEKWILNTLQNLKKTHKDMVFERVLYWKIVATRNITVLRDDKWFNDNIDTFEQTWNYVKYFREHKDKATLIKQYVNSFPLDYYKKPKEPVKNKGIIMKTLQKLYDEPLPDAPKKNHTEYAKFIASIEKEIKESNVKLPKEYDVIEDVEYIKNMVDKEIKIINELKDAKQQEYKKKFIEFIKLIKNETDNYLFQEDD